MTNPAPLEAGFAGRHIPFEACFNFRDVGGYVVQGGHSVRRGLLFRAGALHRMTTGDAARARALGIRTVIDLRRPDERLAAPLGPLIEAGARHHAIEIVPDGGSAILDARYGAGISGPRYVGYLELGAPRFAEAIRLLADPGSYPAVIHCSAGKDRTGTLVAMLLELLGVAREEVVTDFAMSNLDVDRQLRWFEASGRFEDDRLRDGGGSREAFRKGLMVPVEAIEHFLAHLDREHGSVRAFLSGIGVDEATVEAVRGHLLEPARA